MGPPLVVVYSRQLKETHFDLPIYDELNSCDRNSQYRAAHSYCNLTLVKIIMNSWVIYFAYPLC
jgi:hypothetical protein